MNNIKIIMHSLGRIWVWVPATHYLRVFFKNKLICLYLNKTIQFAVLCSAFQQSICLYKWFSIMKKCTLKWPTRFVLFIIILNTHQGRAWNQCVQRNKEKMKSNREKNEKVEKSSNLISNLSIWSRKAEQCLLLNYWLYLTVILYINT